MKIPEIFATPLSLGDLDLDLVPDQDERSDRLARLTESVLERFVTRLAKAGGRDLDKHREILADTLRPVTDDAERHADEFLAEVAEELGEVLPEQAAAVLNKIDLGDWTRRILA